MEIFLPVNWPSSCNDLTICSIPSRLGTPLPAALRLFLQRPGELLTLDAIEAALWPGEAVADPERARGVVKKLRAALGPSGEAIVNRRGQGYILTVGGER